MYRKEPRPARNSFFHQRAIELTLLALAATPVVADDFFYWGGPFDDPYAWTFDFVDPATRAPGSGDSINFIDYLGLPGQIGFGLPLFSSQTAGTLVANDAHIQLDLNPDGTGGRTLNLVGAGGAATLDLLESDLEINAFGGFGGTVTANQGVIVGEDNPIRNSQIRIMGQATLDASDTTVPSDSVVAFNRILVDNSTAHLGATTIGGTLDVGRMSTLTTNTLVADGSILALVQIVDSDWTATNASVIAHQKNAQLEIVDSMAQLNDLDIGVAAMSVGDVTVENFNDNPTKLTMADLAVAINSVDADFRVKSGAEASADNAVVGVNPNSSGTIVVRGVGSVHSIITPSRLAIADVLTLGNRGNATLDVADGGRLFADEIAIALEKEATANVTVRSLPGQTSQIDTSGNVDVAIKGTANVNVINGGVMNAENMTIGVGRTTVNERASGIVTVDGLGSTLTIGDLLVAGDNGNSDLTVSNLAVVQAGRIVAADQRAAPLDEASSTIHVYNSGTLAAVDRFDLGGRGKAGLTVSKAGFVTAREFVANSQLGSLAEITVTNSGSSIVANDVIKLGAAGFTTATIDDGAFVDAPIIRLTNRGGLIAPIGSAHVTVTGSGSMMSAFQEVSVGGNGAATLEIENNGRVRTQRMLIGITNPENTDGSGQRGIVTLDDGIVTTTQVDIYATGTLQGDGELRPIGDDLTVSNRSGTVRPGRRGLQIDGDYEQRGAATLEIGIAGLSRGADFGHLLLDDAVTLDGTLAWELENGFMPSIGDTFEFLSGSIIDGDFSLLDAAPLSSGLGWKLDYGASQATLEVIPEVPGDLTLDGVADLQDIDALVVAIVTQEGLVQFDINGDGMLNSADRDAWLIAAGQTNINAPYLLTDANLDGNVDVSDINIWSAHKYSATDGWSQGDWNVDGVTDAQDFNLWNSRKFTSSSPQAVPEPSGIVFGGGFLVLTLFRFRTFK